MREFPCSDEQTAVRTWGPFGHLEETPLAARGNRLVGVARLGVAFVATAAVALGQALPAFAEEAAPSASAESRSRRDGDRRDTLHNDRDRAHRHSVRACGRDAHTGPPRSPRRSPTRRRRRTPSRRAPSPPLRARLRAAPPRAARPPDHAGRDRTRHERAGSGAEGRGQARAGSPRLRRPPPLLRPPPRLSPPRPQRRRRQTPRSPSRSSPPPTPAPSEAANAEAASAATALIVSFRPRAGISLLPAEEPAVTPVRSIRKARADRQAARPGNLRAARRPRAALGSLRRGTCVRRPACHLHRLAQPGGAGRHRAGRPGDEPKCRRTAAAGVEGRQETHGGRGTTDHPLRQLGSGRRQRRLQRLARIGFVVPPVRGCSSPLAGAAAVPVRPRPRARARVRTA